MILSGKILITCYRIFRTYIHYCRLGDDEKVNSSSDDVGESKPLTPDESKKKIVTYVFLVLCIGSAMMLAATGVLGMFLTPTPD